MGETFLDFPPLSTILKNNEVYPDSRESIKFLRRLSTMDS